MKRLLPLLLLLGLLGAPPARAQAPGDREGLRSGPRAKRDREIRWRDWGRAAFDEARAGNRLVLLDLTAVWCHWCHVMDETSYSDPEVIRLLNERFVPVRVDADRYPQVTDRYISSGWPTTAVLTPEGHILAVRTYVPPAELRKMLSDIADFYRTNRRDIDRKVAEAERRLDETWRSEPPDTASVEDADVLVDRTLAMLRESEDRVHGGFGAEPKFHDGEAVTFLLREARLRGEAPLRAMALRAVDGALRLEDPVWSGFFRYATKADWSEAHYEKMLGGNAEILASCAEAWLASGDRRYREAIVRSEAYAERWLRDSRGGGWFGSQDADVGSHDPGAAFWAGEYYYAQDERARRKLGLPHVDSTLFADANARMAGALIAAVRAGALEESALRRPLEALDRLWRDLRAQDGSLYHAWSRGRGMSPGLLADQAYAAHAFLDAYEATGDTLHLSRARALRDWMRARLEDSTGGGFRYAVADPEAVGRLRAGDRPPGESAVAATLFLRFHWHEGLPEDRRTAERTAEWLRSGETLVLEPPRALLALRLRTEPVRLAVVGPRSSSKTAALRRAALRADVGEPGVRQFERGGPAARWNGVELPRKPETALYVCGERSCAPPITNPAEADRKIAAFLKAGLR